MPYRLTVGRSPKPVTTSAVALRYRRGDAHHHRILEFVRRGAAEHEQQQGHRVGRRDWHRRTYFTAANRETCQPASLERRVAVRPPHGHTRRYRQASITARTASGVSGSLKSSEGGTAPTGTSARLIALTIAGATGMMPPSPTPRTRNGFVVGRVEM